MVFIMKLIIKMECLLFSLLSGFEEILGQYIWCRKSSCTFSADPLTADSCGIPWAFSDIVISCQMPCDGFLSWLKGYWLSINTKNMPWYTQAFLGHSEPLSCTRTVATLTVRLNTTKTCASCGMVRHMEERLHSTLSVHVQQHPPFCPHLPWPSVSLPASSPHLPSSQFSHFFQCPSAFFTFFSFTL